MHNFASDDRARYVPDLAAQREYKAVYDARA